MHDWGIAPVLFRAGSLEIPSYGFFLALALLAGVGVYMWLAHEEGRLDERGIYLLVAAVLGGVLGAKIPIWAQQIGPILSGHASLESLLTGRTIVGGLIGGTLAVLLTRRIFNIPFPSGNLFAPGIALAIGIGRIGCFLRGCCYGIPTALPGGVNFGDGPRIPTQLIESAFGFALFFLLLHLRRKVNEPGRLFAIFMVSYFTFRFGIEFLRSGPHDMLGLSLAQWASAGVVVYYIGKVYLSKSRSLEVVSDEGRT